jgi:MFS family permease
MIRVYLLYGLFTAIPGIFFSTWLTSLARMGFGLEDAAKSYAYFMLGQAFFELPTGFFADRWGRKNATLLGIAIYGLGFGTVYWTSSKYLTYALLSFAGLGMTLISGAIFAWFIAVNAQVSASKNTVPDNRRMFLNLDLIRRVNLGLGSLIGAWLVGKSPSMVWIVLGLLAVLSVLVGMGIISDNTNAIGRPSQLWKALDGIKSLANPLLLSLLALGFLYGIETGTRDSIMQPYVVGYLSKGNAYGMVVVQAIVAVAGIIGNRLAAFWRKNHPNSLSRIDIFMLVLPLFAMALAQFFASRVDSLFNFGVLYFLGMIGIGWFYPSQHHVLNELIPETYRAFALSAVNMVSCLMQAMTCLFLAGFLTEGAIGKFWLIGAAALSTGALVVIFGAFLHFRMQK